MTATNEKLSESEIRYKFLINSIPDVIGALDLDGTIRFVSPQVYDLLGYHPDEMVGTNFFKFIHPDDVPAVTKDMKKAIKSKEVMLPKLRLKHKKGNYILVFAKGKLIKLDDKTRLIGVIRDITKFNETEKKLAESQDTFKQLNEVLLKFKEDAIYNLQLLINAAGLLLNADCALFNILKRVNGKDVLESLVTYNEPPNFTRESDPDGHICTDIIKDNPDDVVILRNLDKTDYIKTDENVRKYDLKQYVSYVVRFNNKPTATFCVVYTENREMSNIDITILQILSKSASTELARWNSQNDLKKSEKKFHTAVKNSPDYIVFINCEGTILDVNRFEKGFTKDMVIDQSVFNETFYETKDQCESARKAINDSIKTGKTTSYEHSQIAPDGSLSFYETRVSPFEHDKENKLISLQLATRDITQRRKIEQNLIKSEEKYRILFESSKDGIVFSNMEGKIMECNQSFLDMLGYTLEEIKEFSYQQLTPEKWHEMEEGIINNQFLPRGYSGEFEKEYIRKDGSIVPISINVWLIKDNQGNSNGMWAIIRDISERKKIEKELLLERDNIINILNSMEDGVYIVDHNYDIEYVNPILIKEFGLYEGKKCYSYFHDREKICPWCKNQEVFKGKTVRWEWYLEKNQKTYDLIDTPLKNIDGSISKLEIFRDITERKKAEQNLKESEFKFRTLFEETLIPILIADENMMYVDANKAALDFVECGIDELRKLNIFAFTPPQLLEKQRQEHSPYYSRRTLETEYNINGKTKTLLLNIVPLEIEGKKLLLGIGPDITERKKIDQKLLESEAKYRHLSNELELILDHIPGVVVYKDTKNNILRVNKFLADISNLKKEEMENRSSFDLYPRDLAQAYWEDDLEVINSKKPKINIVEPWETDAGRRWVNTSKIPYIDENGNVKGIIAIAFDITERKIAEQKLKESEEKYLHLFMSSPYSIIISDMKGNIVDCNFKEDKITGFTKEDIIGKKMLEISMFPTEYLPMVMKALKTLLKGNIPEPNELQIKKKDGSHIWVQPTASIFKLNNEMYLQIIMQDIDTRKIYEEKKKESEAKFRTLFEIAPASIIVSDLESNITLFNQKFCNLHGITQPELLKGRKIQEFIAERDSPKLKEAIDKTFKGEPRGPIQYTMIKEDGTEFLAEGISSALKDKNGKNIGLIGVVQDITERVRGEQKLKESEEKYRVLFNEAPFGIVLFNPDGTILDSNTAIESIFGYKKAELIGRNFKEIVLYYDPTNASVEDRQALVSQGKDPGIREIQLHKKDGELFWASSNVSIIQLGKETVVQAIIQDISKRKRIEKKLKESEERYRSLVEDAQEGIWALDENENTIFINSRMCEMLGYTKNELMGKNLDLLIPDSMKERIKGNRIRREKGLKETYDLELVKKDGTIICTNVKAAPIMSESRDYKGSFAYITDITSQKRAEETLRESEEKFRTISEQSLMGILILQDDKYKYANQAVSDIIGYTVEELLDTPQGGFIKYIHPEDREFVREQATMKLMGMEDALTNYQFRGLTKSGETIWVHLYSHPITFEGKLALLITISDLTELRKIQQDLIESEARYKSLYKNIPVPTYTWQRIDDDLILIDYNKAAEKITEGNIKNLIGAKVSEFYRDSPGIQNDLQRCLKEKNSFSKELSYLFRTIDLHRFFSVKYAYVSPDLVLIHTEDITEKKEVQEALKESEEKYRTVSDYSMVGISIIQDMQFKYVNQKFADNLGYTIGELLKIKPNVLFASLVHPDDLDWATDISKKNQEGGNSPEAEHVEIHCLKKGGDSIWLELFTRSIQFEGRPAAMNASIDITERRKFQQNLEASEEKYRALFENSPIGVAITDYEGKVIEINEYMKKLFGYELKELQRSGVATTYANGRVRKLVREKLEGQGYIQDYEVTLKNKDGKTFPALITSTKTEISGEITYINTIKDITEKKEMEEMKTHLLTRFSHEFKTPLISIKGFSDFLLTEYKNKLDEKMTRFLEKIKEGGDKLTSLVNAFIQSSQLGEKLTRLKKEKGNLSDLIKMGVSEMQGLIHLRKHTIKLDIPDKIIGEFDIEQIYSVITNLLMNAIKYTPPGGKIFIQSNIEDRDIFFSIKDNGIGLSEEDKRHLFKQFGKIERYGNGWDIVTEGMGVGLYLSKEMINLHGGKIWAESEGKNKGSTFSFSLPMTKF